MFLGQENGSKHQGLHCKIGTYLVTWRSHGPIQDKRKNVGEILLANNYKGPQEPHAKNARGQNHGQA